MKKRRLILASLLLLASRGAWSQDMQTAVVLWHDNYEDYSLFTSSEPSFIVKDGNAQFEADGEYKYQGYTYRYSFVVPMSESSKYRLSFEKRNYQGWSFDEVAIHDINAETVRPQFRIVGNQLMVKALKAGESLSLYTPDGKLVNTVKADQSGTAQAELPKVKGTVIVKASESISFKIMVK